MTAGTVETLTFAAWFVPAALLAVAPFGFAVAVAAKDAEARPVPARTGSIWFLASLEALQWLVGGTILLGWACS